MKGHNPAGAVAAAVAVVAVLVGCAGSAPQAPSQQPAAATTANATEGAQPSDSGLFNEATPGPGATVININGAAHLTGTGDLSSTPFDLPGSSQKVDWTSEAPGQNCTFAADILDTSGQSKAHFAGENGETVAQGVGGGTYTLRVTSSCPWIVDMQPASP